MVFLVRNQEKGLNGPSGCMRTLCIHCLEAKSSGRVELKMWKTECEQSGASRASCSEAPTLAYVPHGLGYQIRGFRE